jgi:iron complex outermembrane receptor protein
MKQHDRRLVRAVKQALMPATPGIAPGAAACAGILFALGVGVAAADAPQGDLTEITVTGIRAGIATAISMKEQSDDIIETISAEDLGKLPDLSIADSLARLPGLAAQRTDGRSNFISIRGFAADFSGTTFAGREQASSGENRGVEFDQYPAELINSVEVYKTPDASLIGQGLAGTVNLNTIKPLSSNELKMAFNARGERGSYGNLNPGQGIGRSGSRLSFSIVDQFLDHTLGVAFGVARLDSPIQEKQYQAWYWGRNNGPPGSNTYQGQGWAGPVAGDPDFALSEEGNQARAKSLGQLRTGLMSVLEWAPNESFHSELDLFYSKFNEDTSLNGLQWSSSPWDGISYTNVQTTPSGGQSVLTSGTVNGIKPIMQNEYTKTDTRDYSVGWNNRFELAHNWTFVADLSYSSARDSLHDGYAFTGPQSVVVNGIGFNIPIGGGYPSLNVPVNLADPAQVGFTDPDGYGYNGREEWDRQTDTIKAVRLDVKHPLGWIFKSIDVGFDYSDRKKVKAADVYFAYLKGNGCSTSNNPSCAPYNNALYAPINSGLLYAPTSLAYVGVRGVVNYNVWSALSSQFYPVQDLGGNDYNRNYFVEEKVPLGYVKLDIDTHVAAVAVRGNIGVQFVHTTQSTNALITDPNTGLPNGSVDEKFSYNEVLPSLNLVGQFGNRNYLRLSASKSMMRGRIDDEKAAASASVAATGPPIWSGSGGNPRLKPYIAIGEDLSFEKIFGKASYFSLALFNKNLTSYIFTQTNPLYDFSGYTSSRQAISNLGNFSLPENGSGGKIQGYEVALVLDGGLFTRFLDGFGLQSNFAYTNNYISSSTLGMVPGGPTTFPGFSKKVGALTLYYEKYGASVRIAETYRSPFSGEVVGRFDQLGYTQVEIDRTLNFQAGYEFQDGRLKGLSFLLQINNLSNSPYQTSQITSLPVSGSFKTPLEYDTYGRTFLLGVNYKL